MTRPVFINSATVAAPERFVLRDGRWAPLAIPVRYGRFSHPEFGTCLIDTGYTRRVTTGARSLPLRLYAALLRPRLARNELPPADEVGAILISHLHADHVSALRDYPRARLFASGLAIDHFLRRDGARRVRHGVFRELLPPDFLERVTRFESLTQAEAPLGLSVGFDVFGDGHVLATPLPGHMRGHFGFVWPKLDPPLLYAADAQWLARAVTEDRAPGAPASWIIDSADDDAQTRARIAAFTRAGGRVVYCHDPEPVA
ncbi:MAG TPA: MBL fold metallo-hydrolase [Vitreimonas sp.]|uniref:MBL fold metallo-hydrolase n=1 Tax=Vitreimonas sp. TaxID=3069702 RepID=UPI002D5014F7|nr:MBL fold metallo-hydrolase [Vitreimonas sp.]HYD88080.1 MBL fold metallo-hydrolase [Vitreimonas sp.]